MARPNNSTLLLPFMAVVALIFPLAFSRRPATPSGESVLHARPPLQDHDSNPNSGPSAQPADEDLHNAKGILTRFFGATRIDLNDPAESAIRRNYQLDFMFVTIPDPVDSRLPYLFDRNLTAIQRAAETDSYVLASFDLPWLDEIRARAAANSDSTSLVGVAHDHHHEYETHPGYLLFRQEQMGPLDTSRALLVFLVGETPTTGIQKRTMINALDEAAWLCGHSYSDSAPKDIADEVKSSRPSNIPFPADCNELRVLGPSFSGSAQSLDFALHSWMESHEPNRRPRFRIVSGSATAVPTCSDIFSFSNDPEAVRDWHQWHADNAIQHRPTFAATVVRDRTALNFMLKFLNDSRRDPSEPLHVALLTEGNTAYGSSLRQTYGSSLREKRPGQFRSDCQEPVPFPVTPVDLPFPLHISRLRSESERARKQRDSAQQNSQDLNSSFALPLPTEDDSGDAKDSAPAVSQLDVSASELMLSNLLSTISREQFHYVGIAATDVRDVIFLAREIREHSPATVIFALNADLVYSHPEAYPDTRGMLVVTPYPLFTLNQSWIKPATPDDGGTRFQFPDQDTEGIYNAALSLLDNDQPLLEYASPFALPYRRVSSSNGSADRIVLGRSEPPLWIVTVGRDGFWPVDVGQLEKEDASWSSYTLPAVPLAVSAKQDKCPPQALKRSNRGIVPQLTHAVLILWGFLCIVPAMMFLSRISAGSPRKNPSRWRLVTRFSYWMVRSFRLHGLFRLNTVDAKCFFLIGGTASLSVYAIAITAYSISAIELANPLRWAFLALMVAIILLGLAACTQLIADILKGISSKAARSVGGIERFNDYWFAVPILAGVGLCWICTVWLIGTWISFGGKHPGQGIVTGFRVVNLQNGVSPLVPLFCVGLAAVLWVYCSLRRICFQQEVFPSDALQKEPDNTPKPTPDPPLEDAKDNRCETPFFYSNQPPFQGLLTLERKLLRMLESPTLLSAADSRVAMGMTIALAMFWGGYLFFYRLVFAFEARAFYWLLGVTFLLVVAGILSNVLRVYLLWREMLAILRRLGQLPMRNAFTRFREHNRTLPRMTLTTAPAPLTVMGVSIAAASDLYNAGQSARRVLGNAPEIDRAFGQGNDLIVDARIEHGRALECQAEGDRENCDTRQLRAQCHLNQITRNIEAVLTLSWNALLVSGARLERVEKARQQLEEQAEEFLVSRTVHFLAHMFPQLTNLASYSMGCLFLMLMAISSYPLQPKNPFAYFCWFVIFAFVGVVMHMAVQMNRDAVLSCLNGTKPGEIHWDAGFIGRIVLLIVVPVLGLVGVQFPDTISQILRWVAPSGSGHP
jgi:hypothetical protein